MGKASKTKTKLTQQSMKQPKDRFALWVTLGTVVTTIIIIVTIVLLNTLQTQTTQGEAFTTTPTGTVNDGLVVNQEGIIPSGPTSIDTPLQPSEYTSDKNNISLYMDYACPHCAEFEETNMAQIEEWLKNGTINTVTLHPVAFLSQYSIDAGNAISCAAEYTPTQTVQAHKILMANHANQPQPADIVTLFKNEGITSPELTTCINSGQYENFILAATERAQTGPIPASTGVNQITGTPTVLVNGVKYSGPPTDATGFNDFVQGIIYAAPGE